MTTFDGLPTHPLLVHVIVVLTPLTAVLAIACALWPAARRRFIWLLLPFALIVLVLTPITTNAGEWLEDQFGEVAAIETHADLGETMIYFALALTLVAAAVTAVHYFEQRAKPLKPAVVWAIAAVTIVVAIATCVQVYRIGDSGARAVWGTTALAEP